jgi:hypothetical protein
MDYFDNGCSGSARFPAAFSSGWPVYCLEYSLPLPKILIMVTRKKHNIADNQQRPFITNQI